MRVHEPVSPPPLQVPVMVLPERVSVIVPTVPP